MKDPAKEKLPEVTLELLDHRHKERVRELADDPRISNTSSVPPNCQLSDVEA